MKSHPVAFYCLLVVVGAGLSFQGCTKSPTTGPEPQFYGSLRVVAGDTTVVRSITVDVDGVNRGIYSNPCSVQQVPVGMRDVYVCTDSLANIRTTVEVRVDLQSTVTVPLFPVGASIGQVAPVFSVQSVAGTGVKLRMLRGKVVLLAFFMAGG